MNNAINFERNRMDRYLVASKVIAEDIKKALINKTGMSKGEIKKYLKRMSTLEEKILSGDTEADTYLAEYSKLFDKHGGDVINDYIKLLETPASEYNKEVTRRDAGGKLIYDRNIRNAADHSNKLLNEMGNVYANGLGRMSKVVKMLWQNPVLSNSGKAYIEKIDAAIKRIQDGIKEGKYFPRYLLSHTVEANYRAKALLEAKGESQLIKASEELVDLFSNVETLLPDKARARNEQINTIWSKNPFFVLTQYSKDAIAFNKINFIQEKFIPTMRKFQKTDAEPAFIGSMRNFLEDTFQIATKGLMERPNWVNATVRSLMAAETLKSMGLSVTGAIRNGASAIYFFAEHGFREGSKAKGLYDSNADGIKEKLSIIEREQGFEFKEGGRELIAEGLIPSSKNVTDIVYDPLSNKVQYRDRGALKLLDPLIDNVVGKSLVFHRWTENATRTWMFRVAWVQAYQRLKGHAVLDPAKYDIKQNDAQIQKMATNTALKAVNKYAFEYAAHAKARAVGGTAPTGELGADGLPKMKSKDYAGALGEMVFQFLHYPMSFANLQSKILKGSMDALTSKQYDMSAPWGEKLPPEMKQAMRFAGIYMTVGALSVITNLDLTNSLENDTVKKVKNVYDYFTLPEEELEGRYRGLVNDFTGPAVGDILWSLNQFGITQMPDKQWQKTLLGYINYYEEEGFHKDQAWTEKRHLWNRLNTELARFITKTGPAIRDGRGLDIARHELGWYPRANLKENRKTWNERIHKMTGFEPFPKKDKRKKVLKSGDISKAGEENLMKLLNELRQ